MLRVLTRAALPRCHRRTICVGTAAFVYLYGAKRTFAAVFCVNTLVGSYVAEHDPWFYAHIGLPAVITISALKSISYATFWPLFWPWVVLKWLCLPNRPCQIGCTQSPVNTAFCWTYN